jgi:aspartyl protease family protein
MRAILCFFIFVAVVCAGLSRQISNMVMKPGDGSAVAITASPRQAPPTREASRRQQQTSDNYRTVTVNDNGHGSFEVEARVDGRSLDFIVDTGASYVALRETAAAKLGIHPSARDYTVRIHTANGIGKAAPVMLDRIEINGITVRNVRAIIHPDEALSVNLLGMTFLSKVKWTHDRGRLVLEQ